MNPSRIIVLLVAAASLSGCASSAVALDAPAAPSASEREHQLNLEVADCMRAKDHVVSVNAEGGWGLVLGDFYDTPEETRQISRDYDACVAALGPIFEPNAANAGIAYDESVIVAECLRDAGYPVAEVPDKPAFVREFVARGGFVQWSPYSAVEPSQENDAVWTCPQ